MFLDLETDVNSGSQEVVSEVKVVSSKGEGPWQRVRWGVRAADRFQPRRDVGKGLTRRQFEHSLEKNNSCDTSFLLEWKNPPPQWDPHAHACAHTRTRTHAQAAVGAATAWCPERCEPSSAARARTRRDGRMEPRTRNPSRCPDRTRSLGQHFQLSAGLRRPNSLGPDREDGRSAPPNAPRGSAGLGACLQLQEHLERAEVGRWTPVSWPRDPAPPADCPLTLAAKGLGPPETGSRARDRDRGVRSPCTACS